MILSYKNEAVMGSDETISEWYKSNKRIIADEIKISNNKVLAYIYPIGLNTSDKNNVEKSLIEAIFKYKDYIILVGLSNHQGEDITQDQKEMFYNVLKSIEFKK